MNHDSSDLLRVTELAIQSGKTFISVLTSGHIVVLFSKNNTNETPAISTMDRLELPLAVQDWKGRRYRRFNLEFPVHLKVQSESFTCDIEGMSMNVSVGGLLVRSTKSVPRNSLVTFMLTVHSEQAVRPIHLLGDGEIVRVENQDQNFVLAVKCRTPVTQLETYLPM